MSFFDDDSFEDIVNQFFGRSGVSRKSPSQLNRKRAFIRGEEEDRDIDFIECSDGVYLIFELPGYGENEVVVVVEENKLEISAKKRNGEFVQGYLRDKLRQGVSFSRELPKIVNPKKFDYTMRNGVLEIKFGRKK